ncbi:MAG: hypothetical protein ABI691_19240 [Ginsengibacter sp.]
MIKQLRRRHLQIWSALLILIPAGIVSATIVIPKQAKDKVLQPSSSLSLPNVIRTIDKENYTINLRSNSNILQQVEWINKTSLTTPTTVLYKTFPGKTGIEGADLIGRIESKGIYHFELRPDSTRNYNFILYDFIHHQIIDSINFK